MGNVDVSENSEDYIKAELIIWYQDNGGEYLLRKYRKYKNLFIQRYYKKKFLKSYDFAKDDKDIVFKLFIEDFQELCEQFDKNDNLSSLDNMENNIVEREKTFLNLIRKVHIFLKHRQEIAWPVREIADNVLDLMLDHEKNHHLVGMTIEEDLFDCLMHHISG